MTSLPANRLTLRARDSLPPLWRRLLFAMLCGVSCLLAAEAAMAAAKGPRWIHQADVVFNRISTPDLRGANAMAQDGQGLLWIGGQTGLTRWDGYRLRAYPADVENPAALHDNYIQTLQTDRRGRLWVGTVTGGLARYDAASDAFVAVPGPTDGPASLHVWAMSAAQDGGMWVGTSAGLDHLDVDTGIRRPVETGRPATVAVKALVETPDGALWLATEEGLIRRAPGATAFTAVPLDTAPAGAPGATAAPAAEPSVVQLVCDSAGRVWIGTDANGAFVADAHAAEPRPVRETLAGASGLESENVLTMFEVAPGEMWIGTSGGGIVVVDTRGIWSTRRLRNHMTLPTSLADDDISLIFRDRGGVVWVASTMALNFHDSRDSGVLTLLGAPTGDQAITGRQVPAMLVAADGRVWLSLGSVGGIDILDPVDGRVGQLQPDAARPLAALPKAKVLAMSGSPWGEIFIGTRQGLYRADAAGRGVTRMEVPGRAADAAVSSIAFEDGVLWFGGPDGLWAIDPGRRGAAAVVRRHESAERIGGPLVTALLRGRGNTLWVGTSVGLSRIEVDSDVIERFASDATDPTALPGNYVASLLLDERDRLWVASFSAGLQVLERRDPDGRPRFHRIGVRDGLPHGGVDALLADTQGRIWVSTDGGLATIDPQTYAVRALREADGVSLPTYWVNAAARTAAGELLFGGQGGLTIVLPEHVPTGRTSPPLAITELRAGGKLIPTGRFNGVAPGTMPGEGPGDSPPIDITAEAAHLSVEFSALDYAWPELNRYSYRLAGFDRDWIETDASHRVAAYTNLPPGDYTLQLRGGGPDARATPSSLDLAIRVLPAWYQTMSFRVMTGILAVLLVGLLVHVRTRYLQRRQHELQAQVALRTVELQESQRQLELIAYTDPLTSLENRRRFNENLHQSIALASRSKADVTLLLIDLDQFKDVNDTLGHDAGDALLVEVASRLVATARASDRVARLGGDEFAVVLAGTGGPDEVGACCERILQSLTQPFDFRGHTLKVGASIGAATCPEHGLDPEALYKRADMALYAAKHGGRNTWRLPAAEAGDGLAAPITRQIASAG